MSVKGHVQEFLSFGQHGLKPYTSSWILVSLTCYFNWFDSALKAQRKKFVDSRGKLKINFT